MLKQKFLVVVFALTLTVMFSGAAAAANPKISINNLFTNYKTENEITSVLNIPTNSQTSISNMNNLAQYFPDILSNMYNFKNDNFYSSKIPLPNYVKDSIQ
jgi:hypothetical protein